MIRRCDELLAKGSLPHQKPWTVSDEFRRRQAELALGENLLTKSERSRFGGDREQALEEFGQLIGDAERALKEAGQNAVGEGAGEEAKRIVLSLWVSALISVAAELPKEEEWNTLSEQLRDIGYRIPDESAESLVEELVNIHCVYLECKVDLNAG
jgi:hypothetical protein